MRIKIISIIPYLKVLRFFQMLIYLFHLKVLHNSRLKDEFTYLNIKVIIQLPLNFQLTIIN